MPRMPEPDPPGIPELPAGLIGPPGPRAGLTYRLLRLVWRLGALVLGFRVRVEGLEHLPRDPRSQLRTGGWIAAGMPHRVWIDPFLVWGWLPASPRLVFFGDARTMARSPLRRFVVRRVGGILPIPSRGGPGALATHLATAGRVIDAGGVFCLFPEVGRPSEPGRTRQLGAGIGYVALRTGARIVPIVIGGNDELFLGRRLLLRVLPPIDGRAAAGYPPRGPVPEPGTPEERDAAHRIVTALHDATAAAVADAHEATRPPPGARRIGRRLTHLFR